MQGADVVKVLGDVAPEMLGGCRSVLEAQGALLTGALEVLGQECRIELWVLADSGEEGGYAVSLDVVSDILLLRTPPVRCSREDVGQNLEAQLGRLTRAIEAVARWVRVIERVAREGYCWTQDFTQQVVEADVNWGSVRYSNDGGLSMVIRVWVREPGYRRVVHRWACNGGSWCYAGTSEAVKLFSEGERPVQLECDFDEEKACSEVRRKLLDHALLMCQC